MVNPTFLEIFNAFNLPLIIRVGLLLGLALYTIFAFFIIRQTVLMSQVIHTKLSPKFKAVAYLHFVVSLLVLIITLLVI